MTTNVKDDNLMLRFPRMSSSGDEDLILRFAGKFPNTFYYDVSVVRFLVKQACACIPLLLSDDKARVGFTNRGLPIYQLTLDGLVPDGTGQGDSMTPSLLNLFFRLVEVLLARSLSDSVLHDAASRHRAHRQHLVLSESRTNVLGIHALSQRLYCSRMRTWAEREVTALLNDENAMPILQYVLEDTLDGAFDVRNGCENIYRQTLIWFYCMRSDTDETRDFKTTFSALIRRVKSSAVEDMFMRQTVIDMDAQRITMRGCMVKCGKCVDTPLYERSVNDIQKLDHRPFHLHSLTYDEAVKVGHWGAYMVDYTNGEHAIVLKHVPRSIVQNHVQAERNTNGTLTLDSQVALYHDASRTFAHGPTIDADRFVCSSNLGFFRRASRANNFRPATLSMKDVLFNRRETALEFKGMASSLSLIKLSIPSELASTLDASDRYHGTCHFCHQWRPVTILTYCIQIETQVVDAMAIDS
jgi:hypothetical protein